MDLKYLTTIVIVLFVTFGFEVTSAQSSSLQGHHVNSLDDERRVIGQFYNYVDIITNIKLDNMLRMTQDFTDRLLDSIPLGDRGNTAELLYQYRIHSQRLRDQGGSIQDKENLLMELQQLIAIIKSGLAKQEREDIILRHNLLGMFELLARLSIEERRFNSKFSKAATLLSQRFTREGIERHRELFDLLHQINEEHDIVQREQLFGRFKKLKANVI